MTTELWTLPPKFKIYEALGAVADGRIQIVADQQMQTGLFESDANPDIITARQYSSSRNKYYTITYNPTTQQIMTNDDATWYKDYLGYPALSLLLFLGIIEYDQSILDFFKDIPFKDINQKYNNDLAKAKLEIDQILVSRGLDLSAFGVQCEGIFRQLEGLKLTPLGDKQKPPSGY